MNKISIRNAKHAKTGLHDLCKHIGQHIDTKKAAIIEIGSYVGDSTEIFAQHFGRVIAVDPWQNGYDDKDAASYQHPMEIIEKQFDEMAANYPNIIKKKMRSYDYFMLCGEEWSADVLYIDGVHTYEGCINDLAMWSHKIKKGGFVAGHDYQGKFPGVMAAVQEAFIKPNKTFADTSWIVRKANEPITFKTIKEEK